MAATPADRIACLTPGCPNTIQPATAARTAGYCGPCAGKRAKEARQAYILANRRELDRYTGVTDPVELLRLMHTPPKADPLVRLFPSPKTFEELYLSLRPEEAARLMQVATQLLAIDTYCADNIAKCLVAFTGFALEPMLHAWLDHDRPYPPLIFRGAGAGVRERLLESQHNDSSTLRADHVLSALAWVGDEQVLRYLQRAEAERPEWAGRLYLSPTDYARVAGWEIVSGRRRELTLPGCLALHAAKAGEPQTEHVRIMRWRADMCPWCGCRLVNLIEVDNVGEPMLVPLRRLGQKIEILTCALCACFAQVHAELDAEGHGRWAPKNIPPKLLPSSPQSWPPSPWSNAPVRLSARRPTHAADWCLPTTLSQIGGFPAWVQDLEYPACLKCGRTMIFIAQIDQAAFPGHEGVYYAFVCEHCRTTATAYQQT